MDTTIEKLAKEFSGILKDWTGEESIKAINEKNATRAYVDACASHEFCDPNTAMIEAFANVMGRSINFQNAGDFSMINHAWSTAKENKFYI